MSMLITRDVITDLLPLYLAGEASLDTNILVDEFLAQHPDFAEEVRASTEATLPTQLSTLAPEAEMETLLKTKALLKRCSLFFGLALMFTELLVAFSFNAHSVRWLWADSPQIAVIVAVIVIGAWIGYLRTRHRLIHTGV